MSDVQVDTIDHFARVAMVARAGSAPSEVEEPLDRLVPVGDEDGRPFAGRHRQGQLAVEVDRPEDMDRVGRVAGGGHRDHHIVPIEQAHAWAAIPALA